MKQTSLKDQFLYILLGLGAIVVGVSGLAHLAAFVISLIAVFWPT